MRRRVHNRHGATHLGPWAGRAKHSTPALSIAFAPQIQDQARRLGALRLLTPVLEQASGLLARRPGLRARLVLGAEAAGMALPAIAHLSLASGCLVIDAPTVQTAISGLVKAMLIADANAPELGDLGRIDLYIFDVA